MCGALSGQPQTRMQKTGEERTRATVRSKTSNEGLTSKLGTLSIGAGSEEAAVRGGPLNQCSSQHQGNAQRVTPWWGPRGSRNGKAGGWEPFPIFRESIYLWLSVQEFGIPQVVCCGYLWPSVCLLLGQAFYVSWGQLVHV